MNIIGLLIYIFRNMKKIFILLFVFLISCNNNTPEKWIIYSFNHNQFSNKEIKAKSAEIYDTIFIDEVNKNFNIFKNKINNLDKKIRKIDFYKDSIFNLHYPKLKQDSLIKIGYNRIRLYEREIDHLRHRYNYNRMISSQVDNNICGYYVKIITNKKDTFDLIVSPLTYTIIGSTFMYKE